MDSILGAIISALALLFVSFVGWFSQRASRESRLLAKVERFGNAYAVVPDSPERTALKGHLLKAVRDLNGEFEEKPSRSLVNIITVITSVAGVALIAVASSNSGASGVQWVMVLSGLGLGLLVAGANLAATWFIYRRTSSRAFERRAAMFINGERH